MAFTEELTLPGLAAWADANGHAMVAADYSQPLKVCALIVARHTRENFEGSHAPDGTPWLPLAHPRPDGSATPLRDFGHLMASTQGGGGHVEEIGRDYLTAGTNLINAALHQYGGTILPKAAKALAIPLTKEAKRAGSPRNMQDLFIFRSKRSKKAFLGQRLTKKKRALVQLHYILLRSVEVPARPFVGVSEKLADEVTEVLGEFTQRRLGGN